MVIANTLPRDLSEDIPEIFSDISINHVYIDAGKKWDYQLTIQNDPPLQLWSMLNIQTISKMLQKHYDHAMDNVIHLLERMELSYVKKH